MSFELGKKSKKQRVKRTKVHKSKKNIQSACGGQAGLTKGFAKPYNWRFEKRSCGGAGDWYDWE